MLYKSLRVGGSVAAAVALWGCDKEEETDDGSAGDTTVTCDSDSTGAEWVVCITTELEACAGYTDSDEFTGCLTDSVDWDQIDADQITAIITAIDWDSDQAKALLTAIADQYSGMTVTEIVDLLAGLNISGMTVTEIVDLLAGLNLDISNFSIDEIVAILEAFGIDYSSVSDYSSIIEMAISLGLDLDTIETDDLEAILTAAGVEDAVITEVVAFKALSAANVPTNVESYLTSTDSEFTDAVENMYLYLGSKLVAVDDDDGVGATQAAMFTYMYTLHTAGTVTEDQLTALADATNVWEMMIAFDDADLSVLLGLSWPTVVTSYLAEKDNDTFEAAVANIWDHLGITIVALGWSDTQYTAALDSLYEDGQDVWTSVAAIDDATTLAADPYVNWMLTAGNAALA